jgi:hypothetical protein
VPNPKGWSNDANLKGRVTARREGKTRTSGEPGPFGLRAQPFADFWRRDGVPEPHNNNNESFQGRQPGRAAIQSRRTHPGPRRINQLSTNDSRRALCTASLHGSSVRSLGNGSSRRALCAGEERRALERRAL